MKKVGLITAKLLFLLVVVAAGFLIINSKSAHAACENYFDTKKNEVCVPTRDEVNGSINSGISGGEGNVDSCDNGGLGLSIIICPLIDLTNKGIASLTIGGEGQVSSANGNTSGRKSILISFLELPPLQARDSQGNVPALVQVVQRLITVANIVYVIVFLVLIFASSLPFNIDNYTVKKMLPKLIAAVILTQFSLFICGAIIDFFNLLGLIIPNILLNLSQITITGAGGSLPENIVGGVGATVLAGGLLLSGIGWIIILIVSIVALISVIVAVIYLLIRYFLLYLLILISPFAFVAWVFPGTSKFFTQWWQNFIRLNAMFVTIMALMSSAIVLSRVLANSPDAPQAIQFIASIIPVIALLLIPKTLKATTSGMNKLAAGALNYAGGKAAGYSKQAGSAAYKKGKTAAIEAKNKQAAIKFGQAEPGSRSQKFWAGVAGRFPNEKGMDKMQQDLGGIQGEARKNAASKFSRVTDLNEMKQAASRALADYRNAPTDPTKAGAAHAAIERLSQFGGGGMEHFATLQDEWINNAGSAGSAVGGGGDASLAQWQGVIGASGVDLKTETPQLAGWDTSSSADDNKITTTSVDGVQRNVRKSGVNMKDKGTEVLRQLSSDDVASISSAADKGRQFGEHLNWTAAAKLATSESGPKDAGSINHWKSIGRQGVAYWEKVGLDAIDRGDTAAYENAVQNQKHADTLANGFGT